MSDFLSGEEARFDSLMNSNTLCPRNLIYSNSTKLWEINKSFFHSPNCYPIFLKTLLQLFCSKTNLLKELLLDSPTFPLSFSSPLSQKMYNIHQRYAWTNTEFDILIEFTEEEKKLDSQILWACYSTPKLGFFFYFFQNPPLAESFTPNLSSLRVSWLSYIYNPLW